MTKISRQISFVSLSLATDIRQNLNFYWLFLNVELLCRGWWWWVGKISTVNEITPKCIRLKSLFK